MLFGKNRREEEWKQAVKSLGTILEELKGDISRIMGQNQDRAKDMGPWLDSAREAVGRIDKLEENQKEDDQEKERREERRR